ncbi:isoprenylcysteine carboxyl methyltransferase family protein [Streptococcus catagoni]|uniref:isoprenylcysteine carboxyl methyltransferase family protein n=1 Tax=Streptococcus catagoni TaxID=2654874 RepID=UPI001A9FE66A|nr:isoprenylcysteine carboxyl methyltransferase family protein [Streptococcus catagoni]
MISMFVIRLLFLKVSIANEKEIIANGGKEFGKTNSQFLTLLHIMAYFFSFSEALLKQVRFDWISFVGLILMVLSMAMLYWVTQLLTGIWTVKLMVAKDHRYVDHWLFRQVKHPNYFLNICPELLGIFLLCHASITAMLIIPFYILSLYIRIREENMVLREFIIPNGKLKED